MFDFLTVVDKQDIRTGMEFVREIVNRVKR